MVLIKKITKAILYISLLELSAQDFPSNFYNYKTFQFEIDKGKNWEILSNIDQLSWRNFQKTSPLFGNDSLFIEYRLGLINNYYDYEIIPSLYGFIYANYKKYFYSYYYGRFVNHSYTPKGYSGLPLEIQRLGFNTGETDLSGIGFRYKWIQLQFGRGRENIGAYSD